MIKSKTKQKQIQRHAISTFLYFEFTKQILTFGQHKLVSHLKTSRMR